MKNLNFLPYLVLATALCLASCKSLKVGAEITSLAFADSSVSVGFNVNGKGTPSSIALKADSFAKGYQVDFAGQLLQLHYSDSTFNLGALLNLKTK